MPRQKRQHLKRRKDGRYCAVFMGKQFMGQTEAEALAKRDAYKRQMQEEGLIRENPTVAQFAERWLPVNKTGVSAATYNISLLHMQKLCAVIGGLYVRDVRPSDIKQVYAEQYAGMSDGYIKHAKAIFTALFASAMEDGLTPSNPARAQTAQPHKGTKGTHRAITDEERRLIETVATDHRMHAAAIVMLYAGLRPQEVKALRVEDVDFDKGVIHVRSFIHKSGNNHYTVDETGKTPKATRTVPLFAPVRQALQGKTGLVLAAGDGELVTRRAWEKAWRSYRYAMEKHLNGMTAHRYAHLKDKPVWKTFTVLPYDLRHSFATWCRDNNVELHTCVEWMGHTDAQMILRVYDSVTDTRAQKEADRLESLLLQMHPDMHPTPPSP